MMTREEFVRRLKLVAYDGAIDAVLANLADPPGRRPPQSLVRVSEWHRGLSESDQDHIGTVVGMAARTAVFQLLAVIDGAVSIRETGEDWFPLELSCLIQGHRTMLNGAGGPELHDEFAALVPLES